MEPVWNELRLSVAFCGIPVTLALAHGVIVLEVSQAFQECRGLDFGFCIYTSVCVRRCVLACACVWERKTFITLLKPSGCSFWDILQRNGLSEILPAQTQHDTTGDSAASRHNTES